MSNYNTFIIRNLALASLFTLALFFALPAYTFAASLRVSPDTGVYTVGGVFSARVVVNTDGKPINAAEGTLKFNKNEMNVLSVSKGASIFNLWTIEPSFSNSAGTVSFSGGSPTGYTGSGGTIITVTFKALTAGNPKVSFGSGSVLAADGLGTNVLSTMTGGNYTVSAASAVPEPEYIAPANTPKAPVVTSSTHPDQTVWYTEKNAELTWAVPSGVTAARTLLDSYLSTIPTVVYEPAIKGKVIDDLPEGASYFHIQFKNGDGWGKVAHYRLAIDTERPTKFEISFKDTATDIPKDTLVFSAEDSGSGIKEYRLQLDGAEKTLWVDDKNTKEYKLPNLPSGKHTLIAEAVDHSGNSLTTTFDFTVETFEAPVITDYPATIGATTLPVIKGTTKPQASVTVSIRRIGAPESETAMSGQVASDQGGNFIFVPESRLAVGVYEITAEATDSFGRVSEKSQSVRMSVELAGYLRIGTFMVSLLSVVVPLVALIILLILMALYGGNKVRRLRSRVGKEVTEAEEMLAKEFKALLSDLKVHVEALQTSRKGKLTKPEVELIESLGERLESAERKVKKEIDDIQKIVKRR